MPKPVNCCVPGCLNNFRNSSGLHYYRIPKDARIRKDYVRLLRNRTLKLDSDNTRICSEHFDGGKKINRKHLPSLFPWSKTTVERRELKRISPSKEEGKAKKRKVTTESREVHIETEPIDDNACDIEGGPVDFDGSCVSFRTVSTQTDQSVQCVATQTDQLVELCVEKDRTKELEQEIERLKKEVLKLKHEIDNSRFDIDKFKDKPEDIAFFTGFSDYDTMMLCYDIVKEPAKNLSYGSHKRSVYNVQSAYSQPGRPRKLSTFQEFVIVLMKLRLGLFNRDLAHRFRVSMTFVSITFRTWVRFLRAELEVLIRLPPREVLQLHMPPLFKEFYPRTALIIDCTEIEMERPSALDQQSACYSSYKSRTTMKSLIGITPSGATAFVSELFPGSTSDKEITVKSGLLNHLQAGDEIMADKGFLIQDELASIHVGAFLTTPVFLKSRKQFMKEEAEKNKKVACLRVHVERCMERIKNWHILDAKIPITLAPFASDIFIVISALTNFQPPLIQ